MAKSKWLDGISDVDRIALAKKKIKRVVDHLLYVIELHANNKFVVYSPTLSSQIPKSFAASAFNVFQRSMHQFEVIRLCALWDRAEPEKENIPTAIELIDSATIIDALADEHRSYWAGFGGRIINPSPDPKIAALEVQVLNESNARFGEEQAQKARTELNEAISVVRDIVSSSELASIMNMRDKHLAHSLTNTRREEHGPVAPMKYRDGTKLLDQSKTIVERLYCWVNGTSFDISDAQRIDDENAAALWKGCTIKVLN